MVSKKLATRLEKKREELDGMKAKVVVLQKEVATLEQEAQVELIEQLQKKLGTDNLLAVERFISEVNPVAKPTETAEPVAEPAAYQGPVETQQGGGF